MQPQEIVSVGRWGIILLIIALLLFWSELIFSSLPSLGRIDATAQQLGWTPSGTRSYFTLLAIFDGLGGLLMLLLLLGALQWWAFPNWQLLLMPGLFVIGAYALFQFSIAFWLPQSLRIVYIMIGVVYFGIGFGIWWLTRIN
ncbi:MAG: hypothetical protein AAF633_24295 [Chloroflexota bacterium]